MSSGYDVAVIGAGANGLTAAAYLARAGVDVIVLERRFERGGTLASDDYSTPFTYNVAQESLPLGPGLPAVADLGLADHGVRFVEPEVAVEVVAGDGLVVGRGGAGLRFDSFAPLRHPDGPWYRMRRGYRERCWAFLCQQLPAMREARLLAQFADAPGDLERKFAVTRGGTVRQGALGPGQTLTGRPHPDCDGARTPIEGFYLGEGGAHPGIPGLLAAGAMAARAVCSDHGFGGGS